MTRAYDVCRIVVEFEFEAMPVTIKAQAKGSQRMNFRFPSVKTGVEVTRGYWPVN
jgi:hypothetical protein